ncbi:MAG: integrase [Pseudomonadota bacterium]
MASRLTKRDGFWHYKRRVPADLAHLDTRGIVRHSTKIRIADDKQQIKARIVADQMDSDLEAYWRSLGAGDRVAAESAHEEARKRARAMGLQFVPAAEIAAAPLAEIVLRLERLVEREAQRDPVSQDAALGIPARPDAPPLSMLVSTFELEFSTELQDLSPNQLRKWRHPKERAVRNFISQVGDKPLTHLSRADALDFREWWKQRILEEKLDPDTANKDIGHLSKMLREMNLLHRLGLDSIFADLRFKGGLEASRAPFSRDHVQNVILNYDNLMGLNDEARGVVMLMASGGMRIAEAVNFSRATIRTDVDVAHVQVRPDGRRMKTGQSERDVPLVGVSLVAAKNNPEGFPRYHDDEDGLSATVNKYMLANGMRPDPKTSLYSLRHTFRDSLVDVEASEEMIDSLMGHKKKGPKYGVGPSLMLKQKWVEKIAFQVPR